jgi:Fe-S-cluster containining protein
MVSHHLETDLEKISALAVLRAEENQRFRHFLKNRNTHKVDLLVQRLNNEIAPQIDCTACGNCCRNLSPYLTKEDLRRLTEAVQLPVDEVVVTYTETDEYGVSLKHLPCGFLKDHKCSIYEHRPETCASFPHLHQPDFNSRARRTFDNYAICPIIFNVLERLKVEMHFE